MLLKINGEEFTIDPDTVSEYPNYDVVLVDVEHNNRQYYLVKDTCEAGRFARKYWEDMANDDPDEFGCIIGDKRLVKWALGQSDEYGFDCLDDFLDAVENTPEEELAAYDFEEFRLNPDDTDQELKDLIGFTPKVAYRYN